jgi:hypothetical protein
LDCFALLTKTGWDRRLRNDGFGERPNVTTIGVTPASMELDPCEHLEGSVLGRGGLPKSSPPYGSRLVAGVDVNEG